MRIVAALAAAVCAVPTLAQEGSRAWGLQIGTAEDDFAADVAADLGGVYLTGTTRGSLGGSNPGTGTQDAFLLRYDRDANLVWGRQLGDSFSDSGSDVTIHPTGGAYITGSTGSNLAGQNAGGTDMFLARYDAGGTRLWTRQIGTSLNDSGNSVSADTLGGVFVGGHTFGALVAPNAGINRTDAFLSRYDQNGNLAWTRQWGQSESDAANAVVADGLGGAFVTGSVRLVQGPNQFTTEAFTRHYDRDGNLMWEKILASDGADIGKGIALDGQGGIYVGGQTSGTLAGNNPTPGTNDPFIARYDAKGNLLWVRQINTPGQDFAFNVSSDPRGGVFFTGELIQSLPGETSSGLGDAFVAYFNEAGTMLWSDQFGSDKNDTGVGVSADGAGGVYVSGYTWGSVFGPNRGGEPYDAFLARYHSPAVPEPSCLILVAAAAAALARPSRRRGV